MAKLTEAPPHTSIRVSLSRIITGSLPVIEPGPPLHLLRIGLTGGNNGLTHFTLHRLGTTWEVCQEDKCFQILTLLGKYGEERDVEQHHISLNKSFC